MDDEWENGSSDSEGEREQPPFPKRKEVRGTTKMNSLSKTWDGILIPVQYDHNRRPIPHEVRKKIAGYEGALARQLVPLNACENWRHVSEDIQNQLWEAMTDKFLLDPNTRQDVISSIGVKYRTFKTYLNTKFIYPYRNSLRKLRKPPEKYKFIPIPEWRIYVKSRLTEKFQNLSKKQSERQAKNEYRCRLSRYGYVGLEEIMKKQSVETGIFLDHEDRSFKWKLARQNKKGEYCNDATREVVDKIDDLNKKVVEGILKPEGKNDVLTMALGKPEHCGRVRGEGKLVVPTTYFKIPRRSSKEFRRELEAQVLEERRQKEEYQERVRYLEECLKEKDTLNSSRVSTIVASNSIRSDNTNAQMVEDGVSHKTQKIIQKNKASSTPPSSNPPRFTSKNCLLALKTKANVVARGTVFGKHGPEEEVHNIPLGKDNLRVSIDDIKVPNAPLPIPAGGMRTVKEAHKAFVAWPQEFVLLTQKEWNDKLDGDKQRRKDAIYGKEKDAAYGNQKDKQVKKNAMNGNPKQLSNANDSNSKDGEQQLTNFSQLVKEMMRSPNISTPIGRGVFDQEMEFFYISKSDIIDICEFDELEVSPIIAYQRFLYGQYQNSLEKYGFGNPANFNAYGGSETNNNDKLKHMMARLASRKKDQLILLPYNPSRHWVLIVIDIPSYQVIWLDSLGNPPCPNFKLMLNTAIKSSIAITDGRRMESNPEWESIKCPKQKGFTECGVYTMKFMKHLMEDPAQSTKAKLAELKGIETYSDEELNDIRLELVGFLLDYFPHAL